MIKAHLSHKKSQRLYFAKAEYKKWTKDLFEIEYCFESKYFIGRKPFQTTGTWENLTKDCKTL